MRVRLAMFMGLLGLFATTLPAFGAPGPFADSLMRSATWRKKNNLVLLAREISLTFKTDRERFRAAFAWTAQNLSYDLAAFNNDIAYANDALVFSALQNRKALCEGYVAVLDSLSRLMGISTFKVAGYTRWQDKLQVEPHLWIAVKISENWYFADPTWASGSIINGRFHQVYDTLWFLVPPSQMIRTHMPYDPIWQLSQRPLSHKGFIHRDGSLLSGHWQPNDSIALHLQKELVQQFTSELRRIRQRFPHQALLPRITYLERAIGTLKHNATVEKMQQSNALFNTAVANYNEAVQAYNNRLPRAQVLVLLVRSAQLLESARGMLPKEGVPASLRDELSLMHKQINQLNGRLREAEEIWY